MSLGVSKSGMLTIVEIFLGLNNLPSLDTMYPKITLEYTKNMHFLGLKLIPNFQHFSICLNVFLGDQNIKII
jgi:hypothetical protein